ncbi:glycosyltransferase family A protein [uncultured Chryseobacterium sp.]|uniref:glycosyltransferase family 2 protein n=1 Tax=uncultured Chryseobacterium sp. TaxID=259322 RepID=UPI0026009C02|nr:glycosyltransferase family A protein [uncultured Chryseobacterium sp.]
MSGELSPGQSEHHSAIGISVIIPIYNMGKFLSQAIDSVLRQSFRNFEILLIDDGSNDDSASICLGYVSSDPRITYYYQNNSGVSAARNVGLSRAGGKYVYFLDSDDSLDKNFLQTSFDAAENQNCDILIVGPYHSKRLAGLAAVPTCAQFLKREFLERHPDIRFPENIQPCEDGLFSHQLLALTSAVGTNPDGIYFYRQHESQNHRIINSNTEGVMKQVPAWIAILRNFYSHYDLLGTHALHLILFMEHEPFGLRYLSMDLTDQQKSQLHQIIKSYVAELMPYIGEDQKKLISRPFLHFVSIEDSSDFQVYYERYVKKEKMKMRLYFFLIKCIPLKRLRKDMRKAMREKFER